MDIALARSIGGGSFYALALLFLFISLRAAYSTWRTGQFSSGLQIVPTLLVLVGGGVTGWWKLSIVIILLDLGSLFLPTEGSRENPAPSKRKRKI